MAKSGVSVKWNNLDKQLLNMADKITNTHNLLEGIGSMLVRNTEKRFQKEESPKGEKWKKSQRAIREDGKTLTDKGQLKDSILSQVQGKTVQVGTNKEYARIHQFGGEITPKKKKALSFKTANNNVTAKKVTMPARPFIGISDDDIDDAKGIIADFMEKSFKG